MRVRVIARMYDGNKRMYYVSNVDTPEAARQTVKNEVLGTRVILALCRNIPEPEVVELEAA